MARDGFGVRGDSKMATFTVTTALDVIADDGQLSLREALALANASTGVADEITFASALSGQTITLTGGELSVTDAVTINGDINDDGAGDITIDADGSSRVIHVSTTTAPTSLIGLTITGGNSTGSGGGILSRSGLTIENSTVSGNKSNGSYAVGGGIYGASVVIVTGSTISSNTASGYAAGGGGIYAGSTLVVTDSIVSENDTDGYGAYGGGLHGAQNATITRSTISDNETTGVAADGGGVFAGGALTITASTVSGNQTSGAASEGGGAFAEGAVVIGNSTISSNATIGTYSEGGGVYGEDAITVTNGTISGNSARGSSAEGGGLFSAGGASVTLRNSIVLGNISAQAANDEISQQSGAPTLIGFNIIGRDAASGADVFDGATDVGDTTAAEVFAATTDNNGASAGVLADNGGELASIALRQNLSNPALDNSAGDTIPQTDARGFATADQFNFRNDGDGARDLGAFEAAEFLPSPKGERLTGTSGRDRIDALGGADTIEGFAGADTLIGAGGNDRINGARGADRLTGNGGTDTLIGGSGEDRLAGGSGRDSLLGSGGGDRLNGGDGADTLKGGGGRDNLAGGAGADRLFAGDGSDILIGGGGKDRFIFRGGDDFNVVKDFQNGIDKLSILGAPGFNALSISETAGDAVIRFRGVTIRLDGVDSDRIDRSDFVFSSGASKATETFKTVGLDTDEILLSILDIGADVLL